MGDIRVETTLKDLEIYEDSDWGGRSGHINVMVRLIGEDHPDGQENVLTVALVRLYFKRRDVPLDRLTDSAFRHAHRMIQKLAGHVKSDLPDEDLEPLFVE